jgi:glycosyltransferase involved in cell wall biosynthesis
MISESPTASRLPTPVRISEQSWPEGTAPLVSICCITFNHGKFVREAIEGFLAQETTFPVEIAVHDDASSDETPAILNEYARKYPGLFRLVLRRENQFQKHGFGFFWKFLATAQGDFVAICEGDDHWTDLHKLEKQVGLFCSRPDVVAACHRVSCQRDATVTCAKEYRSGADLYPDLEHAQEIPWSVLIRRNPVQTCSVVYRRSAMPHRPRWFDGLAMGDWPLCLELSTKGVIYYSPEVMATYRVHDTSYWSSAKKDWVLEKTHEMLRRAFCHTVGDGHGLSGRELYQLIEPVLDKSFVKRMGQNAALAWAGFRNLKGQTRKEFLQTLGERTCERIWQVRGGRGKAKLEGETCSCHNLRK